MYFVLSHVGKTKPSDLIVFLSPLFLLHILHLLPTPVGATVSGLADPRPQLVEQTSRETSKTIDAPSFGDLENRRKTLMVPDVFLNNIHSRRRVAPVFEVWVFDRVFGGLGLLCHLFGGRRRSLMESGKLQSGH